MEDRITIKHPGERGWAKIAASAFDPAIHERFDGLVKEDGAGTAGANTYVDLSDLRAEYQEKFGKRPFMGWDAETIQAKLDEAD